MAATDTYIFSGTRDIVPLTSYMLMRGVTDFGNLEQFNLYESGYSFFVVMRIPEFMRILGTKSTNYATLINNYAHILEFENRGISGIDNITSENGQLTNGINTINIINKVNKPSDSSFTANYQEKLGSTITKAHEVFLQGIKDPRTQVKTYLGLIADGALTAGYQNEVFRFMYIVCDNTLTKIEKAICIASAQIKSVPLDIYNSEKGNYEFREISVEFDGFPIMGRQVNALAEQYRAKIFDNTVWTEPDMIYEGLADGAISAVNNNISNGTIGGANSYYNSMNDSVQASYGNVKMTKSTATNTKSN